MGMLDRTGRIAEMTATDIFFVETIHLATSTRIASFAIASREERGGTMVDIPMGLETYDPQFDSLTVADVAVRLRVGTWETLKQVVKAAVFLNNDHDVLNLEDTAPL